KASDLQPHIVLTDLRMPLLDGSSAIRLISKANLSVKCIVLTNYENDMSIIEALEAGAIGYITKNMPKAELFTALDQVSRGY
ncbi:response regulator transcription factor, partial [Acinetobacter baumannii]